MQNAEGKLVILSAPSGAGKTTIMKLVRRLCPFLEFSVSATSRSPREGETHGTDYYFLSPDEFMKAVAGDEFVEWEEVYAGTHYGTLVSELERIWAKGNVIIFDVDVMGGISLKNKFGDQALSIFIMPPSVEELERRLIARGTDAPEVIAKRLAKAEWEISRAREFDKIVINNDLDAAVAEVVDSVRIFLEDDRPNEL